jgi:hypothetical protein
MYDAHMDEFIHPTAVSQIVVRTEDDAKTVYERRSFEKSYPPLSHPNTTRHCELP